MVDETHLYRHDWTYRDDGSMFKSNVEEVTETVDEALEEIERKTINCQRAIHKLHLALHGESPYQECNGHLFKDVREGDERCVVSGCEIWAEAASKVGESTSCPATLETFDFKLPGDGF